MANEHCTNELCVHKETQLHLARLREDLSSIPPYTPSRPSSTFTDKQRSPDIVSTDRLTAPLSLRRSSSATAYLLQSPSDPNVTGTGASARSCPSSVDLSSSNEQRKWFLNIKRPVRTADRTLCESNSTNLSTPLHRKWTRSTNDLISNITVINDKGRLEARRFACDADDNDVRTFKAMVYMEQARKQHARPLTRLRQALGISSNSSLGNLASISSKKHTNS
jgi:hypothetical protein